MAFRLSQKRLSQFLAITVLTIFFWLAIKLLDQKNDSLKLDLPSEEAPAIDELTEKISKKVIVPDISLQDFKRSSQNDGLLRWELEGKTIDLFTAEDLIEILQPRIKSYQTPEDPLTINAKKAVVLFQENDIKEADLKQSVIIKNKIYEITTEQAKYNKSQEVITSNEAVKIIKEGNIINGVGLHANLATEVFDIKSKVDSILKDKEKKKEFKITSEKLVYDNLNSVFTYTGNVLATDGSYVIKSDRLTGNMNKTQELEKLFASGSVVITQGTNLRTFSEKADFDFAKNLIVLTEDPELEKDNSLLTAEKIYYNTETEQSQAEGEVDVKILEEAKIGTSSKP